nr:alpha/beta hydrolase [Corallococcus macrosporus]
MVMHGDDDQSVPIDGAARITVTLAKGAKLQVYPGFSHGMCSVNKDVINKDLLAFIQG